MIRVTFCRTAPGSDLFARCGASNTLAGTVYACCRAGNAYAFTASRDGAGLACYCGMQLAVAVLQGLRAAMRDGV